MQNPLLEFLTRRRGLSLADVLVLGLLAAATAAMVAFARQAGAPFAQAVQIDLSPAALPRYTLFSLMRGVVALAISYAFALVFGLVAASSRAAERVLLPMLDILQSIPVLGFLPGFVLGLVALIPGRNAGLELAAILMIFTAQAWNLALSFYNSLKGVPEALRDACTVAGWPRATVFRRLEVPAAAPGLVWNGMLSMAGGWFFLMVNEAFQLGDKDFRLPGVGAYMSVAVEHGDRRAMALALVAMVVMIVAVDRLFWRPVVVWAQKFRLDDSAGEAPARSWILDLLRRSRLRSHAHAVRRRALRTARIAHQPIRRRLRRANRVLRAIPRPLPAKGWLVRAAGWALLAAAAAVAVWGAWRVAALIARIDRAAWGTIGIAAGLTFARVLLAVALSTAWAVPVGVLIGRSPAASRLLQPVIQVIASFPAPMLFPLVVLALAHVGVGLGVGAVALMILSAQWYILFNVISAVSGVPPQLSEATAVFQVTGWRRWRTLYLPAAFPALVTGWVTAAGGAWNGSIVAEYVRAGGTLRTATGLGSLISVATAQANFPLLTGGIVVMSVIVVGWNRLVWRPLAAHAQARYGVTQ